MGTRPATERPGPNGVELTFIVPVLNDASNLRRCLASIETNRGPRAPLEIVVADNGSQDGSVDVAAAAGARVLRLPGLSVAALRNRGAQAAAGHLLAFVDADHELEPDWAGRALECFRREGVGAAGAPYHPPREATWVQRTYDGLRDHGSGVRDVDWLGSGNMVVRRACFEEIGGFDESLTTCEDVDLCQRLRARGYRIVQDSGLRNTHHGDPRTLRQLFRQELWRGRDNLRVTLRTWPQARELPSLLLPIANLTLGVLAILAILAVILWRAEAWAVVGLAAAGIGVLCLLRAARMALRARRAAPLRWLQIFTVACVYEAARALALVRRTPHRRARRAEAP